MLIDFTEKEIEEIQNCIGQIQAEYGSTEIHESILRKFSIAEQGVKNER